MRKRIMTVAVEEMSERGLKFTMSDLARQLGVSKRCLYEHFESKEDLIRSILYAIFLDIREQHKKIITDPALPFQQKLRDILCVTPTVFSPTTGRMGEEIKRFMPEEWHRLEHLFEQDWAIMADFLQAAMDRGELCPMHLTLLKKIIKGCMSEIVDHRFLAQHNISLEQAKSSTVHLLLYGLIPRGQ